MSRLAILGGGSWGTALALVLAPRYNDVTLWVYETDLAQQIAASRCNEVFLPGFLLPPNVGVSSSLEESLRDADAVLGVMPSTHLREVYTSALPFLRPEAPIVSATKGIERGTMLRMSEVIDEVTRPRFRARIGVLCGPTFAREVARGEPTALVIASQDRNLAIELQEAFAGPTFRPYVNNDPVGVEIGAALKNVIAIAAGVCQGLGLGNNALAALITRGLAEITRLAASLGGDPLTLAGLTGLGDLLLTCTGELSRNRRVGLELARGRPLDEILRSTRMVAEGVENTYSAIELSSRQGVEMPIAEMMHSIFTTGKNPNDALRELMERSLKSETA